MFHYVYVLRSEADGHFYVGYSRHLKERVAQHNAGQVPSTERRRPLELIYYEACRDQADATRREKYLKTAWGKRFIKARLRGYLTG
jgi:putative endonuclease